MPRIVSLGGDAQNPRVPALTPPLRRRQYFGLQDGVPPWAALTGRVNVAAVAICNQSINAIKAVTRDAIAHYVSQLAIDSLSISRRKSLRQLVSQHVGLLA